MAADIGKKLRFIIIIIIISGAMILKITPSNGEHISNSSYGSVGSDPLTLLQHDYMERIEYPSTDERVTELRIAVILPRYISRMFSIQKVLPAMELALTGDQVKKLLPGRRWTILHADSNCSAIIAPRVMIKHLLSAELYAEQAHVFFGPVADYALAPVARFSPVWKIPVITAGALSSDFAREKKVEYPLLTRVGVTHETMCRGLRDAILYYKWETVKVVHVSDGLSEIFNRFCYLTMSSLLYEFKESTRPTYHQYTVGGASRGAYTKLLADEIGVRYAVVVLCASPDTVRDIMIEAAKMNFDHLGEYVFFNIDLFGSKSSLEKPWYRANDSEQNNELARRAYQSVLTVTLRRPDSVEHDEFSKKVKLKAKENQGYDVYKPDEEVNSFVSAFHDAVLLYALAVNETLEAGIDPTNGSEVTRRMWSKTFTGITGEVNIDGNGDRNGDYSLLDMNKTTGHFELVANYFGTRRRYEPVEGTSIHWGGDRTSPPPDVPKCGFDGRGCFVDRLPDYAIVIIVFSSLLLVFTVAALLVYRHYRLEAELQAEVNWRIRWDDIHFGVSRDLGSRKQQPLVLDRNGSYYSQNRRLSLHSTASADTIVNHLGDLGGKQLFTKTGFYKSTVVAVKTIDRCFAVNKLLLLELKKMRDLQNDHIVRFIGLCIDSPHQCLVTEYCQKGSLQDVLENDQIKLDNVFKFSLIQDLVRALSYLHGSEIRSHGNLKSSNCVVDGRFVLKITDFGLHSLRVRSDNDNFDDTCYAYYRAKLWTAPELLRLPSAPPEGTQKGDVYSFAVICQEILHRRGPFWVRNMDHLSPKEICRFVKDSTMRPHFRPTLLDNQFDSQGCNVELAALVKRCWSDDPLERPDISGIKTVLKRIDKEIGGGTSSNLLDNLLSRMEQYTYNLESLVEDRTTDYLEQKRRAEDLLYLMLPRSVAMQLMKGETVTAEKYDSVTIYFSDICGFTSLSAVSTPIQVIDLLNDLYTTFDSIIDQFDVYKVETIGDAYMVVSGLPIPNGFLHAREICRMALRLLKEVKSFKIRHRPEDKLLLRIGIHSGPVCAGVVGLKMPRYCLFGDTVNTASRMESNGEAWKIHVSPQTKEILDIFGTFLLEYRGAVAMKGKGEIETSWLLGEDNPDFPDLAPSSL